MPKRDVTGFTLKNELYNNNIIINFLAEYKAKVQRSLIYYQILNFLMIFMIFLGPSNLNLPWYVRLVGIFVAIIGFYIIGTLDRKFKILEKEQSYFNSENKELMEVIDRLKKLERMVIPFTGFLDTDGNRLNNFDVVEMDGYMFVGQRNKYTHHLVKFIEGELYNCYCFVGLDVINEEGEPSINIINESYSKDPIAHIYPTRKIGNLLEQPELLNRILKVEEE